MKHYIGLSIYDNPAVRSFAMDWFKRNDERQPKCTCGAAEPESVGNSIHRKTCPMYAYAIEGWTYAVDRWMEMEREGS